MAWTRLSVGLSTALLLAAAGPALAQSPQQQADKLNELGKAFLNRKPSRPADATEKFRAAIVLSPEGRFYLNLCMSLYQEGRLSDALNACKAVESNHATPAQVKQAGVIIEKFIAPQLREAGGDPTTPPDPVDPNNGNPTDPVDPNNGNPTDPKPDPNNVVVAPPPSLLIQTTAAPTHEYTWTVGAQVMALSTRIGDKGDYVNGTGGLRLLGDYSISASRGFGAQGYIDLFNVDAKDDGFQSGDSIFVFDLGAAIYKEICRGRMCIKPLAGAHFALMQPSRPNESPGGFSSAGLRGEIGLEYALGKRYENVLTLGVGANLYLPATANSDNVTGFNPEDFGLDQGSFNGYLGIGYTRRFATPLGSQPLFTLQ